MKYYTKKEEIIRRFNNLKNIDFDISHSSYKFNNLDIPENKMKFDGKYTLIINKDYEYKEIEEISDYFNEECRVKCRFYGSKGSMYDHFKKNSLMIMEYIEKNNQPVNIENLHEAIWKTGVKNGYRDCSMFKPKIIIYFIKLFKAKRLLDISSGWGDRLIGAMASDIDLYHGFDPNNCLHKNYGKIINFFTPHKKNPFSEFVIKELPFEKAKLQDNFYDIVMTSPPYFTIEIYDKSPLQSTYNATEREWYDNYLKVWIEICYNALKIDGKLILNINQMKQNSYIYWMLDDMNNNKNWSFLGIISYANENLSNPQPIFIWKKN